MNFVNMVGLPGERVELQLPNDYPYNNEVGHYKIHETNQIPTCHAKV